MEERLLQVCVVLVNLLYLKDYSVFEEQDEIITDMQELDQFLQKEEAMLELELHPDATELPQVSQSHHKMTKKEEEEESDAQQILPNDKVYEQHKHQIPPRDEQNNLHPNLLTEELKPESTIDKTSQQFLNAAMLDKNLSEEEIKSETVRADQNQTKHETLSEQDEASSHKKEVSCIINDVETLCDAQASSAQSEVTKKSYHPDQLGASEEGKDIPKKENKSFFQQIVSGIMPRWFQTSQESPDKESSEDITQKREKVKQADEGKSEVDLGDSSKDQLHTDQTLSNSNKVKNKASQREHIGSENIYTWYLWKVLSLLSVIRLFRKLISRKSKTSGKMNSNMEDKKLNGSTSISVQISLLDNKVLSSFHEQCIQVPPSTSEWVVFLEGFVDDLLKATRNASNEGSHMQIEDFIGIGSFYEGWVTGKMVVFDFYVPITAPRSYSFDFELDMPRCGKIKLVKAENVSNGCPCSNGMMDDDDDDMLCLLHPHNEINNISTDAIGGPLCQENSPYLDKTQVIRWFRETIRSVWRENSHRYEFELAFRNLAAPGALRVRFRSGQVIQFNITPVVQVKGSKICLVSHLSSNQSNFSDTHWPISLANYENALLQHFNKSLPHDSCHIRCLQILSFLHKQQNSLTGRCGLTSHHMKMTLLHLLLASKPADWRSEHLAERLADMLKFLEHRLQACKFHHALLGNTLVPSDISLPKEVQLAKPTNMFLPMLSDKDLYSKTLQHLQELVKNAPLLIHEYVSLKSSEM